MFIDNNPKELKKFSDISAKHIIRINHLNDAFRNELTNLDNVIEYNDFIELIDSNYLEKIGEFNYE